MTKCTGRVPKAELRDHHTGGHSFRKHPFTPAIAEPSVLGAEFSSGMEDKAHARTDLLPNPATDRIQLADPTHAPGTRSWSIVPIDGRTVRTGQGPFPPTGISIDPLSTGRDVHHLHTNNCAITERFVNTAYE